MYTHILVVMEADNQEQKALSRAIHIARLEQAKLTLFISIYDFAYEMTTMLSSDEREQMRHSLIEDRREWIADILDDFDTTDLSIEFDIVWHHRPYEAIIRSAYDCNADLIIKGTRKHDTLPSVIFTPTDWSLLRKAPMPVLLVKDHDWPPQGRVLCAVHSASDSDVHQQLNSKILRNARYMADKLSAELHVVNCYPGAPATIAMEIPEFDTQNYQASVREFHQQALDNLLSASPVEANEIHLCEGMPEDEIPALAERIDTELVVLGTIGRTGLSAAFLGNTAEHVIERLNCDLLALKPNGFKSPIQP